MDDSHLIGKTVMLLSNKKRGTIKEIADEKIYIETSSGDIFKFKYPSAFGVYIKLADKPIASAMDDYGQEASFSDFKVKYSRAISHEVAYVKENGGTKYHAVDGVKIREKNEKYIYSFDTDTELHLPGDAQITLWIPTDAAIGLPFRIEPANVISCEDFSIMFQTNLYIGEKVSDIYITAESWKLQEKLIERVDELDAKRDKLAYMVACQGKLQIQKNKILRTGQTIAEDSVLTNPVTFIWGPPGTGKTTTLAKISSEFIDRGMRVLMVSYSNVSVDGALLRVADMANYEPGMVIRYGYPRDEKLANDSTLNSYLYVLSQNKERKAEYDRLLEQKRKLKRKDPRRAEITKRLGSIRNYFKTQESELVRSAAFVATTVSKAIADKNIYQQTFDLVIFDEASMAYVPQVVYAASLATSHFCCLGDFNQLPAIVQNPEEDNLARDIFEYTGITDSVANGYGHKWLVMLNEQFRMHPAIAEFVSENMYHGLLKTSERIYQERQMIADASPFPGESMGIIDLSKTYSVCIKTGDGSRINILSALLCMKLAEVYADSFEVGIITPFSAQSRLIVAMIRDLQKVDPQKYSGVTCATVHQFQGSEKAVIIYDAVDCFRMPYPSMLLTSLKNNTANRLFNVAMTRAEGKFIIIANVDYLRRKKISKKLIFTKALKQLFQFDDQCLSEEDSWDEFGTNQGESPLIFFGDRDDEEGLAWEKYIQDLKNSESIVNIEIPGVVDENEDLQTEFLDVVKNLDKQGVSINIRVDSEISVFPLLKEFITQKDYITMPITIIDENIVWYGEPLYAADFFSEGNIIETEYFPCMRIEGKYTARILKNFLEIKDVAKNEQ